MKTKSVLVALMLAASTTVVVVSAFTPTATATADCIGQESERNNKTRCVGYATYATHGDCIGIYDESQTDVCDGIDPL